ncbi:MAG TPA: hypothetical protein VMK12_02480, partial [Anaeromyxobacteraceae bacterium]|nr:hypothetical protein [Anaeromyxobacteraceae bacterium]
FGGDAILSDMTLYGMGSLAFAGLYVSIGHIGTGYIYADWIPQITYTSPNIAGFQLSLGAFQPLNNAAFSGSAGTPSLTNHETPMGQFKLSYEWKGPVGGKAWVTALVQDQKDTKGGTVTIGGGDLGLKLSVVGFDLLGYAYIASGVGTTGIGFDGIALTPKGLEGRGSWGYFTQLTYKYWKIKPGISYGESRLNLADDEAASDLVRRNRSLVGGLYFGLTDNLTLTAEYVRTWSANHDSPSHPGGEIADNMWCLGGILFF